MIGLGLDPARTECSRAGCRESALWRVEWRNPKIHSEDRIKVWLACEDHVGFLSEFLRSRSFPVAVAALDDHRAALSTGDGSTNGTSGSGAL
jgi:hypothetical protein